MTTTRVDEDYFVRPVTEGDETIRQYDFREFRHERNFVNLAKAGEYIPAARSVGFVPLLEVIETLDDEARYLVVVWLNPAKGFSETSRFLAYPWWRTTGRRIREILAEIKKEKQEEKK